MAKKVPKRAPSPAKMKFWMKNQKASYIGGFRFLLVRSPTSPNFKTHKIFVLQRFLLHKYISIPELCTILLSRDLKKKTVRHRHPHPHPHPHPDPHPHQNKIKFSGDKSKILIKYKRIKWTPSRKASLLLPGG